MHRKSKRKKVRIFSTFRNSIKNKNEYKILKPQRKNKKNWNPKEKIKRKMNIKFWNPKEKKKKKKVTLLEPKIENSPTCCKFENFDTDP